jgi:hypothetical protein
MISRGAEQRDSHLGYCYRDMFPVAVRHNCHAVSPLMAGLLDRSNRLIRSKKMSFLISASLKPVTEHGPESAAKAGERREAHLEHLEDIWRRQSVMKTMGLIPDVLTSGEEFDIGLGRQKIHRTLSPRLTAEVEKLHCEPLHGSPQNGLNFFASSRARSKHGGSSRWFPHSMGIL